MARQRIVPSQREGLHSTPSREAQENASETFVMGAILVSSSGFLSEGGANPTGIIGVAAGAAHNVAVDGDQAVRYFPALPHLVFEASIDTSAALGTGAIAAADLFVEYGVTEDANGLWYVDKNKTAANARVRIVGFRDAIGTVQGRVYIIFTADATIYGVS